MYRNGCDTGFDFPGLQLICIQRLSSARALGHEPGNVVTMLMLGPLLDTQVTGIPEHARSSRHSSLSARTTSWTLAVLVDAVNQLKCVVYTDVHFQSGKDSVLPHHPPLRTVRESHPSYGSSLSTA